MQLTDHDGDRMPVPPSAVVEMRFLDGSAEIAPAGEFPLCWRWRNRDVAMPIVAWRRITCSTETA